MAGWRPAKYWLFEIMGSQLIQRLSRQKTIFFHPALIGLLFLFWIGSLFLSPQTACSADLTFREALDAMLGANESVRSARSEIERSQHEFKAARGLYFPKVSLSGRWTRIDDPIYIDLDPIRNLILTLHPAVPPQTVPPFKHKVQDESFWKSQLNTVWPVFTGGSISAANRAAEAGTREADAGLRRTVNSLTAELAQVYFAVRLADQVTAVRSEAVRALDRHLFEAQRLHQEGLIARAELLHAQVARTQADREDKAARRDQDLARTALANILATEEPVTAGTPLFMVSGIEPVEEFIDKSRSGHPVLEQLTAIRDKANENVRAKKAGHLPQVYLFGMRELHEGGLTVLDPSWAVGVGADLSLFEGFSRLNQVQAARRLEEKAELMLKKTERDLKTLVSSKYQELMKAREQFDALQASLALADENLRVRQRAFEEGLATSLEVVDARLTLSAIEVERLRSAYDFDVALARLLEASGRGDEFIHYLTQAATEVEK